jgi:micrococcal nuclease
MGRFPAFLDDVIVTAQLSLRPSRPPNLSAEIQTIKMLIGERVRLIGVDTPETKHPNKPVEHFGKDAAVFTRRMVEGKRVRLEFDPANTSRAHKDSTQQRRTLAYVFLEDGTLLNAEIIKQGYGFAYTRFPFERVDEFRRLEREARDQGRGLWASK